MKPHGIKLFIENTFKMLKKIDKIQLLCNSFKINIISLSLAAWIKKLNGLQMVPELWRMLSTSKKKKVLHQVHKSMYSSSGHLYFERMGGGVLGAPGSDREDRPTQHSEHTLQVSAGRGSRRRDAAGLRSRQEAPMENVQRPLPFDPGDVSVLPL